jgi:hypothetical protein
VRGDVTPPWCRRGGGAIPIPQVIRFIAPPSPVTARHTPIDTAYIAV